MELPIHCAMLGYGYWGRNVASALDASDIFCLKCIYDSDTSAQNEALSAYKLKAYPSYEAILADSSIKAVFIITQPHTHFALAKKAIEAKKHIFVEKPLSTNLAESSALYDLAKANNVKLYSNHIFLHSSAIKYLKDHLDSFGEIVYINARRINLGLFQSNVDVIWDLAIHDLSIIDYLVGLHIKDVSTFSAKYLNYPNDAIANINICLDSGIIITLNCSWLSPIKVREMIIGGSKKTAIYDETKREKLTIFDTGVVIKDIFDKPSLYQKMIEYKLGTQSTPELNNTPLPLDSAIAYFGRCIIESRDLNDDKAHILRVIKALELIQEAKIALTQPR